MLRNWNLQKHIQLLLQATTKTESLVLCQD